jgi:transaldolase/glucose-6-phosphate isomerase
VKVPATPAGIPAIRRLIGRGLNINITLLFSVPVYEQVVDAYIQRDVAHTQALTAIRAQIRNRTRAATCLGFGPRFQHSTGQAYKGGPNTGVFLQITCDDPVDIDVPGHSYSFGAVKAAQARGDLEVLVERGRRALRVHLSDVEAGLAELARAIDTALQ